MVGDHSLVVSFYRFLKSLWFLIEPEGFLCLKKFDYKIQLHYMHYLLHDHFVIKMSFASGAELYDARFECEESVVFAHADVFARKHVCTALTYDNRASLSAVTLSDLDAEVFWIGISAVFSCSCGLFMCHGVKFCLFP